MAEWPRLRSSSYEGMAQKLMEAATSKNGDAGSPPLPALTNDDALALVEYWQHQARRNSTAWSGWYEIALAALGYYEKGDKFKVDPAHSKLWLPAEYLPMVWETELAPLARRLDEEQTATKVKPSRFRPPRGAVGTYKRFRRIARAAWERLKRERGKLPIPKPADPIGKATDVIVVLGVIWLLSQEWS